MKRLLFFLSLTLFSCSTPTSQEEKTDLAPHQNEPYPHFNNFPETIYQDIKPGLRFDNLTQTLVKQGWQLKSQNETCHFLNEKDSTTLVIPNYDNQPSIEVSTFKLFLRSKAYLINAKKFQNFLAEKASSIIQDDGFAIIKFDQPELVLSFFEQPTSIRLVINP